MERAKQWNDFYRPKIRKGNLPALLPRANRRRGRVQGFVQTVMSRNEMCVQKSRQRRASARFTNSHHRSSLPKTFQ